MAVTVAQLETYANAAAEAMASGDYATAEKQANAGIALLGAVPEQQKANARLRWTDALRALEATRDAARDLRKRSRSNAVQRTKIAYKRPTT